jgi:glycosyltransferase involved in cell wall biosynthesis
MIFVIELALVLLCAAWIAGFVYVGRAIKRLPLLQHENAPEPVVWPRLSVIIPACNEAATLERALATVLQQDYPDLEIVLIDDRSTDGTGAIMERVARQDPRVTTLRLETLPAGWLGKVHALHMGTKKSSGAWLLFTDADVHLAPGTLRRALALAVERGVDHLALVPRTIQRGFWLQLAVAAFGLLFFLATRAGSVNRPSSRAFIGIGAFNLVNAATFRRTPGFAWLRLEPGDDVGLGMMIKREGGKTWLALAYEHVSVEWYPSLAAMFRGLEKNLFGPAAGYRGWLLLVQVAMIWLIALAPYLALVAAPRLAAGETVLALAALGALGAQLLFACGAIPQRRAERIGVFLLPLGMLLIGAIMIRAGYRCLKNGGIDWRGTHYSMEQLRAGQRIRF